MFYLLLSLNLLKIEKVSLLITTELISLLFSSIILAQYRLHRRQI